MFYQYYNMGFNLVRSGYEVYRFFFWSFGRLAKMSFRSRSFPKLTLLMSMLSLVSPLGLL